MPAKKSSAKRPTAKRAAVKSKKKTPSLRQRLRFSKKTALVVVALFAIVGIVGTYITNAAQITNEETVRLSNGKEIRLGQSIRAVSSRLGNDLFKVNDEQYIYPGGERQPIEVVIETAKGKVVAIHLENSSANVTKSKQNTVDQDLRQVASKERRAQRVSGELRQQREKGLKIEQTRSAQYLLTDHCDESDRVGLVSLVAKGYESRLTGYLPGPTCGDDEQPVQ